MAPCARLPLPRPRRRDVVPIAWHDGQPGGGPGLGVVGDCVRRRHVGRPPSPGWPGTVFRSRNGTMRDACQESRSGMRSRWTVRQSCTVARPAPRSCVRRLSCGDVVSWCSQAGAPRPGGSRDSIMEQGLPWKVYIFQVLAGHDIFAMGGPNAGKTTETKGTLPGGLRGYVARVVVSARPHGCWTCARFRPLRRMVI